VADHQSVLPRITGLPWWGAVVLAVTAAAVGFAYDAGTGDKTLSIVFAVCYVAGCLLAVLAVRKSGLFSAVIQPPLILFFMVPAAYFVFHGSKLTPIKDTLINCGYPLIERFPLMFFTSAAVLLVGMGRWYLGMAAGRATSRGAETATPDASAATADSPLAAEGKTSARRGRRHTIERPSRAAAVAADEEAPQRPVRKPRTATGSTRASRSRHARPPETEIIEPVARPRRPRSAGAPIEPPAEPRRRSRASEPREPRERREPRAPRERRNLPPIEPRGGYEEYDRPQRPERRRQVSDYDAYEPRPNSSPNGSGSHHPVSRVRYRGSDDGESRSENRTRPRHSRNPEADSWRYDV
jgi:hypothetical protein